LPRGGRCARARPSTSSASAGPPSSSASSAAGPTGFRELSRAIGRISDSVLSDRLAELTRAGLVERAVDEGPPVSVSYSLTDCAKALLPALEQIAFWADENLSPADQ
jgi:DNA-binding HxlR family transcriptional regulator